jgi:3-hydroxybutyrate dehydrogenase
MEQRKRDIVMDHGIDAPRQVSDIIETLRGHHAVVTGASRGIGFAIASALARLGANVTLMIRSRVVLADRVAEIEQMHGSRAQAFEIDVTDEAPVTAAFAAAADRLGAPNILVNNAGIAEAAPYSKNDLAMWQRVIGVDLTGAFLCTRQVLRDMVKAGQDRVVNVASTAGLTGYPYVAAYCAAKHCVIGLTRALAREVSRSNITVNAVCPVTPIPISSVTRLQTSPLRPVALVNRRSRISLRIIHRAGRLHRGKWLVPSLGFVYPLRRQSQVKVSSWRVES